MSTGQSLAEPVRTRGRHAAWVNRALQEMLAAGGGVLRREDALDRVDHAVLDRAVRSGRLVRMYPRIYVDPPVVDNADGRVAQPWPTPAA